MQLKTLDIIKDKRVRSSLALLCSVSILGTSAVVSWQSVNKKPEIVMAPAETCSSDWFINGTDNLTYSANQVNLYLDNKDATSCKLGLAQNAVSAQVAFYISKVYELRAKKGHICNNQSLEACLQSFGKNIEKEWMAAKTPTAQATAIFKAQALIKASQYLLANVPLDSSELQNSEYLLPQLLTRYFEDVKQSRAAGVDGAINEAKEQKAQEDYIIK